MSMKKRARFPARSLFLPRQAYDVAKWGAFGNHCDSTADSREKSWTSWTLRPIESPFIARRKRFYLIIGL